MEVTRRQIIKAGAGLPLSMVLGSPFAKAADLKAVKLGVGLKSMSPIVINLVIGEALGFHKEEGFTLTTMALGSNANVQVAVDKGDVDFGVGVPSLGLKMLAEGKWTECTNFYEYTYPYKWDVAVSPDSQIKSYEDLKGKSVGVSSFGGTEFPVTKNVLKLLGIDPEVDVKWVAVGGGVPAGVALQRGQIDALAYYDTGFGQVEAAGIPFRMLNRPTNLPLIGGQFLEMRKDRLKSERALAVGLGRSVAKSSQFILENPLAGAKAFLKMYPETAPKGATQEEAQKAIVKAISRRIRIYTPPYSGAAMGSINEKEFRTEAEMNKLAITDFKPFYTNDLIEDINRFDKDAIKAMAKNYS
jgi:NitT/TauT family transport system substrate-binding protein